LNKIAKAEKISVEEVEKRLNNESHEKIGDEAINEVKIESDKIYQESKEEEKI
jgi:hypothetical protein